MGFVKANARIPARSLVAGIPARVVRELSDEEIAWKHEGTVTYQELAVRSQRSMRPTTALSEVEPDRKRVQVGEIDPLFRAKLKFGD